MSKIIAIDISPIDKASTSQHKVRGVGKYLTLLRDNIEKFDKVNKYIFTSNPQKYSKEVDVIHYPYFDPFFITLPFINKTKTVVTVHDVIPLVHKKHFPSGLKGRFKWEINKRRLKKIDGIITDSKASCEDIAKVVEFDKNKIHVVHLCVDEVFKQLAVGDWQLAIRKKYGLPDKFVLYVGDVTWNKNLPRLVKAIKKADVPLIMVGKALTDEYDKTNLWNEDRNKVLCEVEGNSLFLRLGFVPAEDLVSLYNLAIALCMPSLDEGFGLPVLEAMQSGCPVICSKLGSLPEVGGNAVQYIDAYSVEDITSKIIKLWHDDLMRSELSVKGLERALKFTMQNTIISTVKVFQEI